MRVRRAVHEMAKKFRAEKNGRLIEEPREMVPFKDCLSGSSVASTSSQIPPPQILGALSR